MRRCLPLVVVAAAMSFSIPALADGSQRCPPGAWFCADAEVTVPGVPAPPAAPVIRVAPQVQVVEVPADDPQPAPPPVRRRPPPPPGSRPAPPPVVVYQPMPTASQPQVIVITPGYGYGYGGYGGYQYAPPRPPPMAAPRPLPAPRWQSEWGLNLRVEGVALGHSSAGINPGLGGVGMSLRYRPVPSFAFDLGADVLMGTDYNGFQRTETPLSLSGMLFLNPRSRAQFYLLAGANVARAEVKSNQAAPQLTQVDGGGYGATYTYFGGQGGAGFEFRLSRRVALDLDGIAFIRTRMGGNTQQPEFTDPVSGQTTNTSAGGIFRGGFTFWW